MRFKATLLDINCIGSLTKIVLAVAKLSRTCVLRLTASKFYFILTENQLHGGTNLWCELPQVNFCSGYEFVGHGERNETFLEIPIDTLGHALKSAHQAKVLRIKLAQKATACLTVEVSQPTLRSGNRSIVHDIPIRIIPSRLWDEYKEPEIPEFEVSMYLPPLKVIKTVIERMKNISNSLCISANGEGDMILKVKSEMATVNVSFKDLLQANWKETATSQNRTQQGSQNKNKATFHEVTVDNKRLHTFLSSIQIPTDKIVCNLIAEEAIQIFMIHDQLSMQYTIPAQNVV